VGARSANGSAIASAVCLADVEALARDVLPSMAYEYVSSGAADELTLKWNTEAFTRIRLRPRVMAYTGTTDTRVKLFGTEHASPLLLAPASYHRLMHPDGELATARGAQAAGVTYVISTATTTTLGDIARATTGDRWFQLYLLHERDRTRALVAEAEDAGCKVLCLTVDTPVAGVRNREQRAKVRLPDGVIAPYFHHIMDAGNMRSSFAAPTYEDIAWLQSITKLPVVLKGIMTGEDGARAAAAGVAGVIVSNHGARNLDTVPASIDALPEVVEAVAGRIPVLLDGGVRRGTDIVKSLALGATAVMIGRPYLYGLAVAGADGVAAVVRMLRTELESTLALTGRSSVAALDQTVLWDGSGAHRAQRT
jgi:4-hydroxymandelate oxidase